MLFNQLVNYFEKIEATSLRNQKTAILAEALTEVELGEIDRLIYLSLGGLRPAFDRLEFNLAERGIVRAMGVNWEEFKKIGDLGEVAEKITSLKFPARNASHNDAGGSNSQITVSEVYGELELIARESGVGSQERKMMRLTKLLKSVGGLGAKYVVRMVAGELRLGFSDKTVIDSLSYMKSGDKKYSELIEQAYQRRPDVGVLGKMIKEFGVEEACRQIDVTLGTPIIPALAQRLKTADEMIEKMGRVYVEPKYDGTRVQIHFSRNEVGNSKSKITNPKQIQNSNNQTGLFGEEEKPSVWVRTFTRNLDESSHMFPELSQMGAQIVADEVILDCEAVGYDPKTLKLVPFQLTITRKRKHGVEAAQTAVPLRFFVFDIMYLNGKSLINLQLSERKQILQKIVTGSGGMVVTPYIETDQAEVLRSYHKEQLSAGLEGVLVKQVEGVYAPGRVGFNWVKFKEAEDSRAKLADTLDLVIMGYYLGKGKRSDFAMGAFLVGVKQGDKIVTIAKVGTGITDEMFGELGGELNKIVAKVMPEEYSIPKALIPDVWVEPKIVVEVAADEITVSPTHTAGYALRFPRLVRVRVDKGVEQITTQDEVESML